MPNNKQLARELVSLFNDEYFPKISHSNDESNLETRIEVYMSISFEGLSTPILTGKKVADFSVYSKAITERDYANEAKIYWLDRDFSKKYAPPVMNFLFDQKVKITGVSTSMQ